jgi:hypothetical protein
MARSGSLVVWFQLLLLRSGISACAYDWPRTLQAWLKLPTAMVGLLSSRIVFVVDMLKRQWPAVRKKEDDDALTGRLARARRAAGTGVAEHCWVQAPTSARYTTAEEAHERATEKICGMHGGS